MYEDVRSKMRVGDTQRNAFDKLTKRGSKTLSRKECIGDQSRGCSGGTQSSSHANGRRRSGGWIQNEHANDDDEPNIKLHHRLPNARTARRQPTTASNGSSVDVVWFKTTDLRLDDHLPLVTAHNDARKTGRSVLHLLTLDSTWYGRDARSREAKLPRLGRRRAEFLLQSVEALRGSLEARGHQLLVHLGKSELAFASVAKAFDVAAVYAHGPEFCDEEQKVEQAVGAAVGRDKLRFLWGNNLQPKPYSQFVPQWVGKMKALTAASRRC